MRPQGRRDGGREEAKKGMNAWSPNPFVLYLYSRAGSVTWWISGWEDAWVGDRLREFMVFVRQGLWNSLIRPAVARLASAHSSTLTRSHSQQ